MTRFLDPIPQRLICRDGGDSPISGVMTLGTGAAALAVWQARLGRWLGLEKLAWNDLQPEYDPFKYGSFAVNAGDQVYRLTEEIRSELGQLGATDNLEQFPPVLAFQSVVDATVSTQAVINGLFQKLPATEFPQAVVQRIEEIVRGITTAQQWHERTGRMVQPIQHLLHGMAYGF